MSLTDQLILNLHKLINPISPWCRIYASVNWVIIGSGNGLSPVWRQAITWTNAGLLSVGLLGKKSVNFESEFYYFHSRKCIWKCLLAKWRPSCLGFNVLKIMALCQADGQCVDTAWWRHQMETFSALLALCAGNSPVTGEFPEQSPVTRSFDVLIRGRANNSEAGDLRHHRAQHDVIVMVQKL